MSCDCEETVREILPCDAPAPALPESGAFLIPLCTDVSGYQELIDALEIARGCLSADDCRQITVENAINELLSAVSYVGNLTDSPCISLEERCYEFPPSASFIEYHPQNPYTEPGLIPPGYTFPPMYIADTVAVSVYDAEPGAAITSLERLPPSSIDFPRIRVNLVGEGRIECHMSALNTGGLLVIQQDDDTLTTSIIDLHQDIVGVPPETENIVIVERDFGTPGIHWVDLTFIPTVQDAIPPVLFGGGLVKVVLCGFEREVSDMPTLLRQNGTNPCLLEFSIDGGETWGEAFDYSLCQQSDEVVEAQNVLNYQQTEALAHNRQTELQAAYDGTPESVNPSAPSDEFDGVADTTRENALCTAAAAFVRQFAARKAQQIKIVAAATAAAIGLAGILIPGLGWGLAALAGVTIGAAVSLVGISTSAAIAALEDQAALDAVACCLTDGLTGQAVNQANFETGLDACSFSTGSNAAIVRDFMVQILAENYLVFLDLLGDAKDALDASQDVYCPCGAWCRQYDNDSGLSLFTSGTTTPPTWDGAKWNGVASTDGGTLRRIASVEKPFLVPTIVDRIEFDYSLTKGTINLTSAACLNIIKDGTGTVLVSQSYAATSNTSGGTFVWTGLETLNSVRLQVSSARGASNGTCTITAVRIYGSGQEPSDGEVCP